jgi:hypothetical protein
MENYPQTSAKFVDYNILQFNEAGIAERLWFLFSEKYLDIFLRDCEILLKEGVNLSSLSILKNYPNDFAIEYESMKKVFVIG